MPLAVLFSNPTQTSPVFHIFFAESRNFQPGKWRGKMIFPGGLRRVLQNGREYEFLLEADCSCKFTSETRATIATAPYRFPNRRLRRRGVIPTLPFFDGTRECDPRESGEIWQRFVCAVGNVTLNVDQNWNKSKNLKISSLNS